MSKDIILITDLFMSREVLEDKKSSIELVDIYGNRLVINRQLGFQHVKSLDASKKYEVVVREVVEQ